MGTIILLGGIITLILFVIAAYIGMGIMKGKPYSLSTHKTLAIIAVSLAIIHGIAGYIYLFK